MHRPKRMLVENVAWAHETVARDPDFFHGWHKASNRKCYGSAVPIAVSPLKPLPVPIRAIYSSIGISRISCVRPTTTR